MKKNFLKLMCFALILALAMLAAVACDTETGTSETATTAADADGTLAGTPTDGEQIVLYSFPDVDFGGQRMRIITQDRSDWAWSEMTTEEELTGDPINDAIFSRNAMVEQGLNVEIVEFHLEDAPGMARRAITAGIDEYDVIFTDSSQAGTLASQGMYLDLHNVPGLYLENPWWNQNANQSAELLGRLFFTTSDANLVTNDAIWVLYYNKRILQDHQMADPVQMVHDGTWTIDVFYEMARDAARDITGSGVWSADDQWGISTHGLSFLAYFICQGQQLVRLNADGEPYVVAPDDRFIQAFMNAHYLMNDRDGLFLYAQNNFPGRTPDLDHASKTFMHDMSLFCAEVLAWAREFRVMEADFGLLPHPKFDVHQENYYTLMIDTVPAFGIPVTVSDSERVGIFMEAMTGISATTIIPAYYDVSLHGKFTRSDECIEMLDIIREGRIFDLAILYNWAGYYGAIITNGNSNNPSPVTVFERHENRITDAIERTLDMFRELD